MPLGVALLLVILFVVALLLAVRIGQRSWRAGTSAQVRQLTAAARAATVPDFSASELDGAPPPVARYLSRVLHPGQRLIHRATVRWQGEFNLGKPGADRWKPFAATQVYTVDPPGFVWDASIAWAPGFHVLIRDSFAAGVGSIEGRLAGLVSVVDRAGTPELAVAALQRHLSEAMWFPTALLPSQGVGWTAIDDSRALATLTTHGVTAKVEFRFGPDGRVTSVFVPERLYDNGKEAPKLLPWQARNLTWRPLHGTEVPAESIVEWVLPGGPWAYWRGGPVEILYELD